MRKSSQVWIPILLVAFATVAASAQSFRVQCPPFTITHPLTGSNCTTNPTGPGCNNTEPTYNGPTQFTRPATGASQFVVPTAGTVNGAIKCQQVSGGDGYSTMADGTQTFMFAFGPLSGLADVAAGLPGTQVPNVFNTTYMVPDPKNPKALIAGTLVPGDPATTDGATAGNAPGTLGTFTYNGAVGLAPEVVQAVTISDLVEGPLPAPATAPGCLVPTANTVTAYT